MNDSNSPLFPSHDPEDTLTLEAAPEVAIEEGRRRRRQVRDRLSSARRWADRLDARAELRGA